MLLAVKIISRTSPDFSAERKNTGKTFSCKKIRRPKRAQFRVNFLVCDKSIVASLKRALNRFYYFRPILPPLLTLEKIVAVICSTLFC